MANTTLEIRAAGSLSQVASAIRKELQPRFPDAPLEVRALTEQVERTLVQERLMANLAGGFGVVGLLLACIGLYGLLAYSVARRTKEIGIRMALGAQQSGVLWMVGKKRTSVTRHGCRCGATSRVDGVTVGELDAVRLEARRSRIMATATLLLGAAGLAAAYFPARRGARVDPMTALRHE